MSKIKKLLTSFTLAVAVLVGLAASDQEVSATGAGDVKGAYKVATYSREGGSYPETIVLMKDRRTILSSGYNYYGALGRGVTDANNRNRTSQFAVSDTSEVLGEIEQISISERNSLLVDSYGEVYLAGEVAGYQKGDGTNTYSEYSRNRVRNVGYARKYIPLDLSALNGAKVVKGVVGYRSVKLVDENGDVWVTGYNTSGHLGTGNATTVRTWTKVFTGAKEIYSGTHQTYGGRTTYIIDKNGGLWAAGYNYGTFNTGNTTARNKFQQVTIPNGDAVKEVAVGARSVHVLTENGTLYAGGTNYGGTLGGFKQTPAAGNYTTYVDITAANGFPGKVEHIYPGTRTSWLVLDDGSVWSAGRNNYNQLGYKFNTYSPIGYGEYKYHQVTMPDRKTSVLEDTSRVVTSKSEDINNPLDISAAFGGTVIINEDGEVKVSGRSDRHSLGKVTNNPKFTNISVDRFIYNARVQFFNDDVENKNRTVVDPSHFVIGVEQMDTTRGAPDVVNVYELYRNGDTTPFRTRTVSMKEGTKEVTLESLKLAPGEYVITSYRKTVTGPAMESVPIERKFTLTIDYSEPGIDAEDRFVMQNSTFDPKAGAYAFNDNKDDISSKIQVTKNTVDITKLGSYDVEYYVYDDLSKKDYTKAIRVHVIDSQTTYDDITAIRSEPWTMNKADVKDNFTDSELNTYAKTYAWTLADNRAVPVSVYDHEIKAEVGPHDVTFIANDAQNKTHVNVIDSDTVINQDVALKADNFVINKSELEFNEDDDGNMVVDDEALLNAANALAWDLRYGNDLNMEITVKSTVKAEFGVYVITITAYSGDTDDEGEPLYSASKTVRASVIDDETVYDNSTILRADGFKMTVAEAGVASNLSDTSLKTKGSVAAWNRVRATTPAAIASTGISISGHTIKAEEGIYSVTYKVVNPTSSEVIEKTVPVVVTDSTANEFIIANGFTIKDTKVAAADFVELAGAKAWDISNPNKIVEVPVTLKGEKPTEIGTHTVTFTTENGTEKDVEVIVSPYEKNPPVLNVTTPVTISLGATFDPMINVSATDKEDGTITGDVKVSGEYDVNKAGLYILTYSITDSDENTVTKNRTLIVNDGSFVVGTNYAIQAKGFVINKPDVDTSTKGIIDSGKAKAFKLEDASEAEVVVDNSGGYTDKADSYVIRYAVKDELTTRVSILANVIDNDRVVVGDEYSIAANDITIKSKDVVSLTNDKLIDLSKAQSWKNDDYSTKGTVVPTGLSNVKEAEGTYEVTLTTLQDSTATMKIKVNVIDADNITIGDEYVIASKNVTIGKLQAAAITNDQELKDLTSAKAWKKNDLSSSAEVVVLDSNLAAAKGSYTATFAVKDETATTVDSIITVTDTDHGNNGLNYAIEANDFSINSATAKTLTVNDIITKAAANAWQLEDSKVAGTVKVTENTVKETEGAYKVELYVSQEPTTKVTITVTVSNGKAPELKVTSPVVINVGGTFDEKAGVEVSDDKDPLTVNDVKVTGNYDVNKAAVYVLTYTVEDSDFNKVSKTRVLVVNDGSFVIGTDYILKAKDFVINKPDVKTTDTAIKTAADAKAYLKADGSEADVTILDNDEYKAQAGTYSIQFAVENELVTTKTIKATVLDYGKVVVGDEYSIAANDFTIGLSDAKNISKDSVIKFSKAQAWKNDDYSTKGTIDVLNISNVKAADGTYKVTLQVNEDATATMEINVTVIAKDEVTIGENYGISANNVTIGKSKAAEIKTENDLVNLMNAEAWKLSDKSVAGVQVDSSELKTTKGEYKVIFSVKEEVATKVTATITVLDKDEVTIGENYGISANNVTISKVQAAAVASNNDLIALTKAEAWKLSDNSSAAVLVDNSELKAEQGEYKVTFSVRLEDTTTVTVIIKVQDKDHVTIGENYGIGANDVTIGKAQAAAIKTETDLINLAEAEAWKLSDNSVAGVQVDSSELKVVKGEYKVIFSVKEEEATKVEVTITVEDKDVVTIGENYGISTNNVTIGKTKAAEIKTETDLINLTNAEAWKLSDKSVANVQVDSSELKAEQGEYKVIYSVKEEVATKVTATITVLDKDEVTIGENYGISANNVTVGTIDAKAMMADDDKIIEIAKAEAWKLSDKSAALVQVDSSTIKAENGKYKVVFSVKDEPATKVEVTITVDDRDVIEEGVLYKIGANHIIVGKDQVQEMIDQDSILVQKTNASAWLKTDYDTKGIVDVEDKSKLKAVKGEYEVTFNVQQEPATKVTVTITVTDGGIVDYNDEYAIETNNVTVGKEQAKQMIADNNYLISATGTNAWIWKGENTGKVAGVDVLDKTNLKAEAGTYTVKFAVKEDNTVAVESTITVKDNGYVDEGEEYGIGADDIVMGIKDAEAIKDNKELIDLANANSWKKTDRSTPAGTVELAGTDFKAAVGDSYYAEFKVKEEETTKVRVKITVRAEDHVDQGVKYTIVGNDFTINTADAATIDKDQIISKAVASAWLTDNEATKGTVVVTENTVKTTPGDYKVVLYVSQEPATKVTITVTVSDGKAPELKVTTPIEINVGGTFNEKAGITVSDDKDALTVDDVTMSGTYDVNKEGTYVLTYSVKDSDNNTTTAKRLLVVNDGHIVIGDKYVVEAYDFEIAKADVDTSDNAIKTAAKAKAYKIEDSSLATVNIDSIGGYTAAKGEYTITFSVAEESATKATAKANVLDKKVEVGDKYSIAAKDITVGKEQAQAMIDSDNLLIEKTEAESWITGNYASKVAVKVSDKTKLKATDGVYEVTFVSDKDATVEITATITVKDLDVVEQGEKYEIGANHITIGKSQAQEMINDSNKLIEATKADAWLKDNATTKGTVEVFDKTKLATTDGTYEVTFNVKEEEATKVTVKVTVKDLDVVETGDKYSIGANHITIGTAQAQEMIDDSDKLVAATKAEAWLKDNATTKGTALVFDKANLVAAEGDYEVTFNVEQEPATKVTVTVTVFDKSIIEHGEKYSIGANHITIGKAQAEEMIADNNKLIEATKAEAWIKDDYATKGTALVFDKSNLVAADGTYEVTFNVEQEPATKATVKITVKDKDVIVEGKEYAIGANHIIIGKDQANEMIANDKKLIDATAAEAWKKDNASEAGKVLVLDKTNLVATKGIYEVTFNVEQEPAAKVSVNVEVTDGDIVDYNDLYAIQSNNITIGTEQAKQMLTDNDYLVSKTGTKAWIWKGENAGTDAGVDVLDKTSLKAEEGIYKVKFAVKEDNTVAVEPTITVLDRSVVEPGDKYDIGANHITIGKVQAQEMIDNDAKLIAGTKAEAWLKDNYASKVAVEVSDKSKLQATNGAYEVTFNVKDETATKVTVTITVEDKDVVEQGVLYNIGANHITVGKDDAKNMITTDNLLIGTAQAEAWKKDNANEKGTVIVTDKTELKAVAGEYEVQFAVDQEKNTTVTITVTVIDKSVVIQGDKYDIGANHITIGKDKAKEMIADNAVLIDGTKAEAWEQNKYANKTEVVVADKSKLEAKNGVYEVEFAVKDELTTKVKVKVTVVDKDVVVKGEKYEIGANHITIGKEDAKSMIANNNKLIAATDAEAWIIGDYNTKGTVYVNDKSELKAETGIYEVEFVVKEENATKVKVKVTVIDKSVVVEGKDYSIGANNITVGKDDIKEMIADNNKLISAAEAEAWEKGNYANKVDVVVSDKSGLGTAVGTYDVTFGVKDEQDTKVTITITVIDKSVVVEGKDYSIGANHISVGKEQAEEMIADNNKLIDGTKAEAWEKDDYATKAGVEVLDKTKLQVTPGEYEVAFNVKEEPTTTIKVKITVRDFSVVEQGDKYEIGANHITVGTEDVKELIQSDNKLITTTGADAWLKEDFTTKGEVQVSDKTELEVAVGIYNVEFKVKEEGTTRVTIKVEVIDKSVVVSGDEYYIGANYVTVKKVDAQAMIADDNKLVELTGAEAWKKDDKADKGTVEVLDKANLKETNGSYEVEFGVTEDGKAKVKVIVTVVDKGVIGEGNLYDIGADNKIVGKADAQDMIDSDKVLVDTTKAEAWVKNTYDTKGTVKVLDKDELKAEEGKYTVEFVVEEDPTAKVKVTIEVRPEDRVVVGEKYMITANDIEIDTRQAAILTDDEIKELSKAKAWLINDEKEEGTVEVKENTVVGKGKGTYKVNLFVKEEEKTAVNINVVVVAIKTGSVSIQVIDKKDNAINVVGSVFELQDKAGNVVKSGITTNAFGMAQVKGLADGEYKLVQTAAPEGYFINKLKNKVVVVVGKPVTIVVMNEKKATN